MATVEISGLKEAIAGLSDFESQHLPFALKETLNEIGLIAKDNAYDEFERVFKSPTPMTMNSLRLDSAKKTKLEATVLLKDPLRFDDPHHYLNVELNGGERGFKPFEARLMYAGIIPEGVYAVPAVGAGADIDAYGNMKRGQIVQILSYFDTFNENTSMNPNKKNRGFDANMGIDGRAKLRKGTKKRHGFDYFAIKPGQRSHLKPGIYKRTNLDSGRLAGPAAPIRPVLMLTPPFEYSPRINLQRIINDTFAADAAELFEKNLDRALRTARWAIG